MNFYVNGREVSMLPSERFVSAWMPAGADGGYVSVDLGVTSKFDKCVIRWAGGSSASGHIEISDNGPRKKQLENDPEEVPKAEPASAPAPGGRKSGTRSVPAS